MTKSSRVNRRKAVALTLALASTSAFAITGPARAELGPNAPVAGDVRVTPSGPLTADGFSVDNPATVGVEGDGFDQPAPVIALGVNDQAAAGAQIRIHNQWRSGDRVLFQVRASDGENCANVPTSIGYSAAPTAESSDVAYSFAANSPMAISNPPAGDNNFALPDAPVPAGATVPQVKPEFQVNLLSSTQCAPNGVTDIVEILFTNQSATLDPASPTYDAQVAAAWVLSLSGISYDVGTNVTAGPLRNLPLAQDATATPGNFINSPGGWFGGNLAAVQTDPLVQELWTTTAFIVPVLLTAEAPGALIADGFFQSLGTVTLTESRANGLVGTDPDNLYTICYQGVSELREDTITATGPVVPGSIVVDGTCISFRVAQTGNLDSIVFSNIFGRVLVGNAGPVRVLLTDVPDAFQAAYLTANDNGEGPSPDDDDPLTPPNVGDPSLSNSVNSDVNDVTTPFFMVPLANSQALPERIGGADRFETAAKIAYNLGCSGIAVLVNGNAYPDALSATYLAGALSDVFGGQFDFDGDVPILLTETNSLPQATIVALRETGVRSVYIVGGTNVVSQQVEDELSDSRRYYCRGQAYDNNQNLVVNRIAGPDRYDTNNAVIEAANAVLAGQYNARPRYQAFAAEPSKRTALVATGENFADALIGGQFAYERFPLILTTGGTLSPQALTTMTSIDIEQAIILGGESAVSAAVEASIEAAGVTVIRLAGDDRYETGVAVNNWALADDFPGDPGVVAADLPYDFGLDQDTSGEVFLARGDVFADALASAPLVSDRRGLLALTDRSVLSPATEDWLQAESDRFDQAIALGLGQAISTAVLNAANAAIN